MPCSSTVQLYKVSFPDMCLHLLLILIFCHGSSSDWGRLLVDMHVLVDWCSLVLVLLVRCSGTHVGTHAVNCQWSPRDDK